MNNTDTLSLYITEDNTNILGVIINNHDKNTTSNYELNLYLCYKSNLYV